MGTPSSIRRLTALESAFPELKGAEALSDKVGAKPSGKFAKIRHRVPMLSLANAFSDAEVRAFDQRMQDELRSAGLLAEGQRVEYACEVKFDGLAINLRYEQGVWCRPRRAAMVRLARM